MSNRKKIIISIFSLLLCVLVTYAWINELQNPTGRYLTLKLNKASVANSELEVKLFYDIGDDNFCDITRLCDEQTDPAYEAFNNFAPGSRQKFRVDITNLSDASLSLRMILSDIICDNEELQNSIIIGTNGFSGFTAEYPEPMVQNNLLSNGMDGTSNFVLVDSVVIPPHNLDEPVSIYFYVMFAASGREQLENQAFSIGKINFLTL